MTNGPGRLRFLEQAGLTALVVLFVTICGAIGLRYAGLLPSFAPDLSPIGDVASSWKSALSLVVAVVCWLAAILFGLAIVPLARVVPIAQEARVRRLGLRTAGGAALFGFGVVATSIQPMPRVLSLSIVGVCLVFGVSCIAVLLTFAWRESSLTIKTTLCISASILASEATFIVVDPAGISRGLNDVEKEQGEAQGRHEGERGREEDRRRK